MLCNKGNISRWKVLSGKCCWTITYCLFPTFILYRSAMHAKYIKVIPLEFGLWKLIIYYHWISKIVISMRRYRTFLYESLTVTAQLCDQHTLTISPFWFFLKLLTQAFKYLNNTLPYIARFSKAATCQQKLPSTFWSWPADFFFKRISNLVQSKAALFKLCEHCIRDIMNVFSKWANVSYWQAQLSQLNIL